MSDEHLAHPLPAAHGGGLGHRAAPRSVVEAPTQEAEALLALLDALPSGAVLCASDGHLLGANAAATALLGDEVPALGTPRALAERLAQRAAEPEAARAHLGALLLHGAEGATLELALAAPEEGTLAVLLAQRWSVERQRYGLLLLERRAAAEPVDVVWQAAGALAQLLRPALETAENAVSALDTAPRSLDPAIYRHATHLLRSQLTHLHDTLADLETLRTVAAGTWAPRLQPLDLGDLLMALVPRWQERAASHSFELALHGTLPTVLADAASASQVLDALLAQAVAHSPAEGSVRVSVRQQQEAVCVRVRHHGATPLPEALARQFDPAATNALEATGLRLTLAREVVRAHGGHLWAEPPEEGAGMVAVLTWPLVPPARLPATVREEPQPAGAPVAPPLERRQPVALLLEREPRLLRYLRSNLEAQRYKVITTGEPEEVLHLLDLEEPDILLLGGQCTPEELHPLLRRLRAASDAPVLVLAPTADPLASAAALDLGAADYIPAPYSIEEVNARIRAALRRRSAPGDEETRAPVFTTGDLVVDFAQRTAMRGGTPLALSRTEFKLLRVLAQHAGQVLPHAVLLERVWGPGYGQEVEFVWVYIRRLRRKVEPEPSRPRYIQTVPGVGYRLARVPAGASHPAHTAATLALGEIP